MKFLINNPLVIVIVVVFATIIIYFGWLLIQEIKLNNVLKIKHQSMRSHKPMTSNKKRLGFLSSATLSPALAVLLFIVIGVNQPLSPSGDTVVLNTENDILDVYETFQKRSSSTDLESNDPGIEYVAGETNEPPVTDEAPAISDELLGEAEEPGIDLTTEKLAITYSLSDSAYVYSVNSMTLISSSIETDTNIPNLVSEYSLEDLVPCGTDYQEKGLFVDLEDLIVISDQTSNVCSGGVVNEFESVIHVFDKEAGFMLTDKFVVSGSVVGLAKIDNMVIVATKTELDYNGNLDDYLPYMRYEGATLKTKYSDIHYVEGTSPTSYISIFAFDLETKSISSETVLVDNAFDVYLTDNAIYIVGNVYEFEPLSDYFEYEDPVSTKKVLIYEFVQSVDEIAFSKTEIK